MSLLRKAASYTLKRERAARIKGARSQGEDAMTIVVTVKVTDGMVLAADSAASFFGVGRSSVKIYNNANKIFNSVIGQPIGAMVYGVGSIGSSSIETLSKDLRTLFRKSVQGQAYYLDLAAGYTIENVTRLARQFFEGHYRAEYPTGLQDYSMGYRVCGYNVGAALPEIWEFRIYNNTVTGPYQIQAQQEFGLRWAGENEPLDRLLLGRTSVLEAILINAGISPTDASDIANRQVIAAASAPLALPAMPIQDAIDVARFLVDTAAKFARYGMRPETIGGPTEIASITKHEGFKWVERKHYYPSSLNQETDHV
jgi:hypothetical protein